MKQTRIVPFDVNKAKNGAQVVTRCGYSAEVKFHNVKVFPPIICLVEMEGKKKPYAYTLDGKYTESSEDSDMDLFIEEEVENDSNNQDETIRKALISYFQSFPYNSLEDAGVNAKDAIAWLKKQGDTADNKPRFHEGDWMKPLVTEI